MSGQNLARGQEKFIVPLTNFTSDQSCDDLQYQTGQNVNGQKRAADTVVYGTYAVSTGNLIGTGSTQRVIKKTAHNARKNDVVQFTSGNSTGIAIQILSCPDANTMILAATAEFALSIGDTFDIKRYISPQYNPDGSLSVTAVQGPVKYNLNGSQVEVTEDTVTPANNKPLPVKIITSQSQTGSFDEDTTVSTTPETIVAPAGAFACFIETDDSNTVNLRVKMGATASTTSGIQFQPGRSEFYQGGSNISYCSESGSGQKISVQWFIRS